MYCVNSDAFVIAYFGILKTGATVVPVNLLLNPEEAAYNFNDAGIKGLLYFDGLLKNVEQFYSKLNDLQFAICIGSTPCAETDLLWKDVMQSEANPLPGFEYDTENDIAAILYTSGTTGKPKGAMLTHRNLMCNAWSVKEMLHLTPGEDSLLVVLPLFHAFAATACMLFPMLYGMRMIILPRVHPEEIAKTIESQKATVFLGVPSMYNILLHLPDEFTPTLQSLKFCISGGAAMPVEIMRKFEERYGVPIQEGDGPTECSPVTSVNPIGGKRKPQTIGLPVPLVEMKIMDENGQECPHGTIGEICVKGPNVMKGYWQLEEETKQSFFGDWFRTGDLGTEDEEGYFSIVDRKKDMIIVNGMNVYPRMVEEVLYRHESVREAAVVGEPNDLHGEIPVAYLSLKEGATATTSDVRKFCLEHLGRFEIPRKFNFMDELPKNAAGKIMKRELRKHGELERGIDSRG